MTHETCSRATMQDVMTRLDALESLLSLFSIYVKDLRTAIKSQTELELRNAVRNKFEQALRRPQESIASTKLALPTPYKDEWLRQQSTNRVLSCVTARATIESAVARSITYGVSFREISIRSHSVGFWAALLTGNTADSRTRKHMSYVLGNSEYFIREAKNRFRVSDAGVAFAQQIALENKCTLL